MLRQSWSPHPLDHSASLKADPEPVGSHRLVFKWVGVGSSSQRALPHTSVCLCVCMWKRWWPSVINTYEQDQEIAARQLFLIAATSEVRIVLQRHKAAVWYPQSTLAQRSTYLQQQHDGSCASRCPWGTLSQPFHKFTLAQTIQLCPRGRQWRWGFRAFQSILVPESPIPI